MLLSRHLHISYSDNLNLIVKCVYEFVPLNQWKTSPIIGVGNKQRFNRMEEREGLSLGEHKPSSACSAHGVWRYLTTGRPVSLLISLADEVAGLQSPFSSVKMGRPIGSP